MFGFPNKVSTHYLEAPFLLLQLLATQHFSDPLRWFTGLLYLVHRFIEFCLTALPLLYPSKGWIANTNSIHEAKEYLGPDKTIKKSGR